MHTYVSTSNEGEILNWCTCNARAKSPPDHVCDHSSYYTLSLSYVNKVSFLPQFIAGDRHCVSLPQRIVALFMQSTHSREGQGSLVWLPDPNITITIVQMVVADQRVFGSTGQIPYRERACLTSRLYVCLPVVWGMFWLCAQLCAVQTYTYIWMCIRAYIHTYIHISTSIC
jgi:hypothetical protein